MMNCRQAVHVHNLHATIPHLPGLHHERLAYSHNGREERVADVAGKVIKDKQS